MNTLQSLKKSKEEVMAPEAGNGKKKKAEKTSGYHGVRKRPDGTFVTECKVKYFLKGVDTPFEFRAWLPTKNELKAALYNDLCILNRTKGLKKNYNFADWHEPLNLVPRLPDNLVEPLNEYLEKRESGCNGLATEKQREEWHDAYPKHLKRKYHEFITKETDVHWEDFCKLQDLVPPPSKDTSRSGEHQLWQFEKGESSNQIQTRITADTELNGEQVQLSPLDKPHGLSTESRNGLSRESLTVIVGLTNIGSEVKDQNAEDVANSLSKQGQGSISDCDNQNMLDQISEPLGDQHEETLPNNTHGNAHTNVYRSQGPPCSMAIMERCDNVDIFQLDCAILSDSTTLTGKKRCRTPVGEGTSTSVLSDNDILNSLFSRPNKEEFPLDGKLNPGIPTSENVNNDRLMQRGDSPQEMSAIPLNDSMPTRLDDLPAKCNAYPQQHGQYNNVVHTSQQVETSIFSTGLDAGNSMLTQNMEWENIILQVGDTQAEVIQALQRDIKNKCAEICKLENKCAELQDLFTRAEKQRAELKELLAKAKDYISSISLPQPELLSGIGRVLEDDMPNFVPTVGAEPNHHAA